MIQNDRQFKITQKSLRNLRDALAHQPTNDLDDWVVKANRDALASQIGELEELVDEYEVLKAGTQTKWSCTGLEELPIVLIKARISSGKTQKNLAEDLKLKPQQVQRYEATNYQGANLERLIEIATALNIEIESIASKSLATTDDESLFNKKLDWSEFPIREMLKREWIGSAEEIGTFFQFYSSFSPFQALHRKSYHGSNRPNEHSLLAWQTRVLQKAQKELEAGGVNEFVLTDTWIEELVAYSVLPDSLKIVTGLLREKGILLVFEPHLPKTYLDGAAMLSKDGHPIIGMTLRHDRLDNFWFVLLHELGHVYLHLLNGPSDVYFDDVENDSQADFKEKEADSFALKNLISENNWLLCVSRFQASAEAVKADSKRLNIHPSIIAGRIRKESNNYMLLNEFVGSGMVRSALKEYI